MFLWDILSLFFGTSCGDTQKVHIQKTMCHSILEVRLTSEFSWCFFFCHFRLFKQTVAAWAMVNSTPQSPGTINQDDRIGSRNRFVGYSIALSRSQRPTFECWAATILLCRLNKSIIMIEIEIVPVNLDHIFRWSGWWSLFSESDA